MHLLFDIGGTKIRLAVANNEGDISEPRIFPTPETFEEGVDLMVRTARELYKEKFKQIVGGIKGPLDKTKSLLLNPPDLPDWKGRPLKSELESRLGASVQLENDADLVGLGEAMKGAGMNHGIVVYLTISTGVGGVRIINGEIDKNAFGFEPGHQVIDINSGLVCGCGGKGHLEAFIGGVSLRKRYGKKPEEITDENVWKEVERNLAYGINNTILHWSPDVVVVGGSLVDSISLERVAEHLKSILKIFPEHPKIKKASLGDIGGLHGALEIAKSIST